jgi:PIN domain nuclease of toxin-antitoxin system
MLVAVADTHTLIWYIHANARLSKTALSTLESAAQRGYTIGISSITFVEITYLIEKQKIPATTLITLMRELQTADSMFAQVPVTLEIAQALSRVPYKEVPDMPDRIIAATAVYLGVPVINRDGKIRMSSITTIW